MKRYHRNGNRNKSQWTISQRQEVLLFQSAFQEADPVDGVIWSLLVQEGIVCVVGRSRAASPPQRQLKISRFNDNAQPSYWFGYPADYELFRQDRPPMCILMRWFETGIIGKADISRIRQGKRCNLSD